MRYVDWLIAAFVLGGVLMGVLALWPEPRVTYEQYFNPRS